MITRDAFACLAQLTAPVVASVYLPTHVKGREIRQDPIRLKNALAALEQALDTGGVRRSAAEPMLAPARRLVDDELFWRYQGRGLALFLAEGFFQLHKLPLPVEEMQVVAPRPHLKPLLPLFAYDGRYLCLAASAGEARLYEGSRYGFAPIETSLPQGVEEIAAATDYQNMRHAAPPARPRVASPVGMPSSHTFGEDPEEQRKAQLLAYLRRLSAAVGAALNGESAPLVLAAAPEVHGHLRALPAGEGAVAGGLQIDPFALDEAELHARSYALVQPLFAQARSVALARFAALEPEGRTAQGVDRVAPAAETGRVDTLFLCNADPVWGQYDAGLDRVRIDPASSPDNEDLLDRAAVRTLLQGGAVHVLSATEMPGAAPIAAVLRY